MCLVKKVVDASTVAFYLIEWTCSNQDKMVNL